MPIIKGLKRLVVLISISFAIGYAVEPGKPSRTAVFVLQWRALGTTIPEPQLRNPDTLAVRFFGAREREVLSGINQPIFVGRDFPGAWQEMEEGQRRIFLHALARTRMIDNALQQSVREGASQVVILGAGYDSRAYRFAPLLRSTKVFEVDFPPTQEYKKLRVREVLGQAPKNVVFVPIDFGKDDLEAVLRAAGYRPERKTVFIWEGVTYYIPESAVDATLRFVAGHSGVGSIVVFDYEYERAVSGKHDDQILKQIYARLANWGEAHIFGMPNDSARGFVIERGLTVVADLGPKELTQQYLTTTTGIKLGDEAWYFGVCIARVPAKPQKNLPASPRN
jgi:methyltransferase (TIGR00027 family)